jgi:hypothetical protein
MNILSLFAETSVKIDPSKIGIDDPVRNADITFLNILNTAYLWAGIVCVIVIIIAGFYYVVSNGDAAKIKRGKDGIMGAVVGLIFVILAFTITQFIIGRF